MVAVVSNGCYGRVNCECTSSQTHIDELLHRITNHIIDIA